jgi:hypothetical protein
VIRRSLRETAGVGTAQLESTAAQPRPTTKPSLRPVSKEQCYINSDMRATPHLHDGQPRAAGQRPRQAPWGSCPRSPGQTAPLCRVASGNINHILSRSRAAWSLPPLVTAAVTIDANVWSTTLTVIGAPLAGHTAPYPSLNLAARDRRSRSSFSCAGSLPDPPTPMASA